MLAVVPNAVEAAMATYAIGDIQGCYRTLRRLLDSFRFDAGVDRLWLVGDLVNRGPRSLDVLRWARDLGDRITMVLGNHDLHLLGRALGVRPAKGGDTLDQILAADDRDQLLGWLVRQPLLHREGRLVLVHAGLHPWWTLDQAETLAAEIKARLRGEEAGRLLRSLSDRDLPSWRPGLPVFKSMVTALQALVLIRMCSRNVRRCPGWSGPPEHPNAPGGCLPWFDLPDRRSRDATVICGHWSALGLRMRDDLIALDTGCVWRGQLSAVRLEDRTVFQVAFAESS